MQQRAPRVTSAVIAYLLIFLSTVAFSQGASERTLDEIKTEAAARAAQGRYPLIGLDPADVREAFASIKTRDPDEWAASFMKVADRYMNEGKSIEATNRAKANADYIRAWRLYSFGRWPVPSSPGKQRSYAKAIEAFLAHAGFSIRRSKWCAFRLKAHRSLATCGCQKMPRPRCLWLSQSTVWIAGKKTCPKASLQSCRMASVSWPWMGQALVGHPSRPARVRIACCVV